MRAKQYSVAMDHNVFCYFIINMSFLTVFTVVSDCIYDWQLYVNDEYNTCIFC